MERVPFRAMREDMKSAFKRGRRQPFIALVIGSICSAGSDTSLTSGMAYAKGAIRSSVERFENASQEVTRQTTALSQGQSGAAAANDLGAAIIDQKTAGIGVSANVKTVQAFDDMLRELTLSAR
jgi:hypothetical protein